MLGTSAFKTSGVDKKRVLKCRYLTEYNVRLVKKEKSPGCHSFCNTSSGSCRHEQSNIQNM